MKLEKFLVHASQALFAMIVLSCFVAGCGKREEKKPVPEVYPAEGHAYMKDPAFKKQLAVQEKEKKTLLDEREKLFAAFAALEKREGSRAAAERSPEWKILEKKAQDCMKKFDANRLHTTELFAARAKQAQADSAKIARGEAKAAATEADGEEAR